ncbi:MAG: hypothetical protein GY941_22030 [Planctomycetes bacterium]|nr:hypothetical protein [Planctomycetota bacterium]
MKNNTFLNNLWYDMCGLPEDWSWLEQSEVDDYVSLLESEWDEEFYQQCFTRCVLYADSLVKEFRNLARNRMVLGAIRYGKRDTNKHLKYDLLGDYARRVDLAYTEHNLECFIDAYNVISLYAPLDTHLALDCGAGMIGSYIKHRYISPWELKAGDDGEHCKELA